MWLLRNGKSISAKPDFSANSTAQNAKGQGDVFVQSKSTMVPIELGTLVLCIIFCLICHNLISDSAKRRQVDGSLSPFSIYSHKDHTRVFCFMQCNRKKRQEICASYFLTGSNMLLE